MAILAQLDPIDAFRVPLLGDEQPLDKWWSLGQDTESTEEVVIVQHGVLAAKHDVTGLDGVVENMKLLKLVGSGASLGGEVLLLLLCLLGSLELVKVRVVLVVNEFKRSTPLNGDVKGLLRRQRH